MKLRVKLGGGLTHVPMPPEGGRNRKLVAAEMPDGGFEVERDMHVRRLLACGDLVAIEDRPEAKPAKAIEKGA